MQNQEFREEKDKHEEQFARLKKESEVKAEDFDNKVIECNTLIQNISILKDEKCELQKLCDGKFMLYEKMKGDAMMDGVSGCLSVASGERMSELDVNSSRAIRELQTKHMVQLKECKDVIVRQLTEVTNLSDDNHTLNMQISELNLKYLTLKQEHSKKSLICSPGHVQSVSTLGGESSVVNRGTGVDSTSSRLNMNEGAMTIFGSGTKVTTDTNCPSISGGVQPSNLQSDGSFVQGSLSDKANNPEKDCSNLSMNESNVISRSGPKYCTDLNVLTGSKVIEAHKDSMSLDMSKDRMSVDATAPEIVQVLEDNMNMLEKVHPSCDPIVVDKAKEDGKLVDNIVPPSGSKTGPVEIDDSVVPTSEVLHHVRDELESVEKMLKNSEQNETNNSSSLVQNVSNNVTIKEVVIDEVVEKILENSEQNERNSSSSSVQDLTSDDIIEDEVIDDVPNNNVTRVTQIYDNYYVGTRLLSTF